MAVYSFCSDFKVSFSSERMAALDSAKRPLAALQSFTVICLVEPEGVMSPTIKAFLDTLLPKVSSKGLIIHSNMGRAEFREQTRLLCSGRHTHSDSQGLCFIAKDVMDFPPAYRVNCHLFIVAGGMKDPIPETVFTSEFQRACRRGLYPVIYNTQTQETFLMETSTTGNFTSYLVTSDFLREKDREANDRYWQQIESDKSNR